MKYIYGIASVNWRKGHVFEKEQSREECMLQFGERKGKCEMI